MRYNAFYFHWSAVASANAVRDVPLVHRHVFYFVRENLALLARIIPLHSVEHGAFDVLFSSALIARTIVVIGAPWSVSDVAGALRSHMHETKRAFQWAAHDPRVAIAIDVESPEAVSAEDLEQRARAVGIAIISMVEYRHYPYNGGG